MTAPTVLWPKGATEGLSQVLVGAVLCLCLGAVLAFDLSIPGAGAVGNPTAIVVVVAVVAGWALRLRWAAPLWALCVGVCAVGVAGGDVPPLNALAISLGAVAGGIGSHAGGRALRDSLDALDRQVQLIRRASAVVAGRTDPAAMLEEVLHATVAILTTPREPAGAAVLALEGEVPRLVARAGRDPLPHVSADVLQEALRTPRQAIPAASGRAALSRIEVGEEPWGVLVAARDGRRRLSRRELTLVLAVADLAGVALDSRLQAHDTERLRDRLQVTLDLAVAIGSSLDPSDVATGVLRRACEALDADRAALARVQGAETEVVAVHDRHRTEPLAWTGDRFPTDRLLEQPGLREAIERRTPVAGGRFILSAVPDRYRDEVGEVRAMLAMPLVAGDVLVGVLSLSRTREVPFTDDDRATLSQFASVTVLALMNAWAHSEMERERRSAAETASRLRMAVEAAEDVGFETELSQVTRRLLVRAAQAVGADRGSIGVIDEDRLIVEADWSEAGEPGATGRTMSLAGVPDLLDRLRAGQAVRQSVPALQAEGEAARPARHGLQCPLLAGGELVGVMSLSRTAEPFDDAELRALQQLTSLTALTLRSARQLALARGLGQAKSEFLNMAAHELRTPLAVVRGYLSMMADGTLPVPETTGRVVSLLCEKTDELSAMIEKILTAAQIQAGGMELQRRVFDLREAIAVAIERARPHAERAGVELWCQPLPDPVRVDAVRASVGRILDNLLSNAVTYGNHLPARLTVEVGDDVVLRVEDQGLGISPDQQARLFQPFFRVDQPGVQVRAGAGLGLAVSRQLAELSGGSLELEWTQPGAGSTFALRLPRAPETEESSPAGAQPGGRRGSGPR